MLAKTLGRAAITAGAQVIVLAFDVVLYGIEALEAYQKGDFDTMTASLVVASAELAGIVLYVKLFRAYRVAQAAVLIGEAASVAAGMNVVPHAGQPLAR